MARMTCVHVSGLLVRRVAAGQDGFRDGSSQQYRDFECATG